jgi:hypothetical protein
LTQPHETSVIPETKPDLLLHQELPEASRIPLIQQMANDLPSQTHLAHIATSEMGWERNKCALFGQVGQ